MVFDFGLRLKELRETRGLTQKEVANLVGVSKASIYKYENNLTPPNIDTLKGLAVLYRVSTDYLLGLEHKKSFVLTPDDETLIKQMTKFLNEISELWYSRIHIIPK